MKVNVERIKLYRGTEYKYFAKDDGRIYFGVEFEYYIHEDDMLKGMTILVHVLNDITHIQHDETVTVELPTDPLEFTEDNIKEIQKRIVKIEKLRKYFKVYRMGCVSAHVHVTNPTPFVVPKDIIDTEERLKRAERKVNFKLFGRQWNKYAEPIFYASIFGDYPWICIPVNRPDEPTIEYRLPRIRTARQYAAVLRFIKNELHPAIIERREIDMSKQKEAWRTTKNVNVKITKEDINSVREIMRLYRLEEVISQLKEEA